MGVLSHGVYAPVFHGREVASLNSSPGNPFSALHFSAHHLAAMSRAPVLSPIPLAFARENVRIEGIRVSMSFRRLLRDITTGMYYDGRGGWTPNDAEAYAFPDSHSAVRTGIRLGTKHLHLVLKFHDARLDVSHPLAGDPPKPGNPGTAVVITSLLPVALTAAKVIKKIAS